MQVWMDIGLIQVIPELKLKAGNEMAAKRESLVRQDGQPLENS